MAMVRTFIDAHLPETATSPVVVSIPHAGTEVGDIDAPLRPEVDRRCDADLFVDQLYAGLAPGAFVVARLSRFVCDLNRNPENVSIDVFPEHPGAQPDIPRGFAWQTTTTGQKILQRPLTMHEWQARKAIHTEYHGLIARALADARAVFGFAVLVDGHSMPSRGRAGPAGHPDAGQRRPDVVPGDLDGTSCHPSLRNLVVSVFERDGFSVSVNNPYRGGYTTLHHGQPGSHIHAIQIELRRDLYMDEATYTVRPDGFARVRITLGALFAALASYTPQALDGA